MKNLLYLIIPILGLVSNKARGQERSAINNSVSTIQRGTIKGNAEYDDWGLLILVGVIGFTGIISRKKQIERKAD